jgi:hypothetical protein
MAGRKNLGIVTIEYREKGSLEDGMLLVVQCSWNSGMA